MIKKVFSNCTVAANALGSGRLAEREVERYDFKCLYRVDHHVSDLGWVDLDLICSTTLLGQ